jgi:hypothetical protein
MISGVVRRVGTAVLLFSLAQVASCREPNPAYQSASMVTDAQSAGPPSTDAPVDRQGPMDVGGPSATLLLNKSTYAVGEAIVVAFSGGAANATDWIGLYETADPAPIYINRSTAWYYTDNTRLKRIGSGPTSGSVTFATDTRPIWPLPAGAYKAIFFANDVYIVLAGPVFFDVR